MLPKPTGAAVRLIPPVVYFVPFAVMWGLHWWRPCTIPGGSALTVLHSWWPLLVLPGILLVIRRKVVDPEEAYLTERFGDAYREYQRRVRRWL